jgi:hypothetical protein
VLRELVEDYPVLVPGELIEHAPAHTLHTAADEGHRHRVMVYPVGVCHVAQMPGMYSAVKRAKDRATAARLLLGEAFPLMAACCSPALDDPASPVAELAAVSWLRQSADRPEDDPPEDHGGEPSPPPTFSEVLATLVAAGHRVDDVLHRTGVGQDGHPLPYRGWTVPQLVYHWRATLRLLAAQRAEHLSGTMSGIVGTFGDDDARDAVGDRLRRLRRFADGPPRKVVEPEEPAEEPTPEERAARFPTMLAPPRPVKGVSPTDA